MTSSLRSENKNWMKMKQQDESVYHPLRDIIYDIRFLKHKWRWTFSYFAKVKKDAKFLLLITPLRKSNFRRKLANKNGRELLYRNFAKFKQFFKRLNNVLLWINFSIVRVWYIASSCFVWMTTAQCLLLWILYQSSNHIPNLQNQPKMVSKRSPMKAMHCTNLENDKMNQLDHQMSYTEHVLTLVNERRGKWDITNEILILRQLCCIKTRLYFLRLFFSLWNKFCHSIQRRLCDFL